MKTQEFVEQIKEAERPQKDLIEVNITKMPDDLSEQEHRESKRTIWCGSVRLLLSSHVIG